MVNACEWFLYHPLLQLGAVRTQVQDLTFGIVEPDEVHMHPLVGLVQFSLDGIPSLGHVNPTTQLLVICKLSVGALHPMSLMMLLNSIGLNMDLWGDHSSLISILSLDFLKLNFLSIYVISPLFLISPLSWRYPRTLISALHAIPSRFFSVK